MAGDTRAAGERRVFVGALGIYTAGGLFWAFLPYFVGLQTAAGGLTQTQAGSLASVYLVGFSVASLSALWWAARLNWRLLIGAAAALIVVALMVLAQSRSYGLSLGAVSVIGLMMGSLWTIAYRIFAASANPDRSFAAGIVISYSALALFSYLIGGFVIPGYGLDGAAYLLGAVIVLLSFNALLIPSGPPAGGEDATAAPSLRPPPRIAMALLGILATAFAFAAVWAFAERIGVAAGFDETEISPVIASNLLATAAGSVLATLLGTRFGRKPTLLFGLALMLGAVVVLSGAANFWLYATAIAGLGFAIGFLLPYQMATLAVLDVQHRFVLLIAAAQGLGSAAGPFLGGLAADAGGMRALLGVAGLALGLSALLFLAITPEKAAARAPRGA